MESMEDFTEQEVDKKELLDRGIASDEKLKTEEKATNLSVTNDVDFVSFYSDIRTIVKWFLTVEESIVNYVRFNEDGKIIAVKGRIPKGIVKLQGQARKSNAHSQMVTYGPNND